MRGALAQLRRTTGLPVAFGGLVEPGRQRMRISEFSGAAGLALRRLAVTSGNGLGGKAVALARPCAVTDYSLSRQISHEYDAAVAEEGLRSVLAIPVVVRRRVRGVLYGALRTAQPLGDRTLTAAVQVARDVEQSLVLGDEARDLLSAARPGVTSGAPGAGAGAQADWEQVREAHAALRALAPGSPTRPCAPSSSTPAGCWPRGRRRSRRPSGSSWLRVNWMCWRVWRRGRRTRRPPSGWDCARRRSRAISGRRCAGWARARGERRWPRPAGRVCCRSEGRATRL